MATSWSAANDLWRKRGPELVLAALAGLVFLGCLGSVELWGKREQRASAEAIDTVDQGHWLVARIQGRPRLEKPPLPRWTVATLITLTGRRDEWLVRLPAALSALGMVGLVYGMGCRLGGRSVGLASGLVLTSMGFFTSELRQAGNDGPLAFFATLALYCAWRRLNGDAAGEVNAETTPAPGARGWSIGMYAAMGLGFLCKGPVVLLIVALAVVPYLACARRLRSGLRLLADGPGLLLFVLLALSWPLPVALSDPNAAKIWLMEMGQKAGTAGISHHRQRLPLAAEWPWMTVPWVVFATTALALPFLGRGRDLRPGVWFPWWWSVGNLAMFCFWSVAKPNYYLPCLPGVALLTGLEWVRVTRNAREWAAGVTSRRVLQFHWVVLFVAGLIVPVAAYQKFADAFAWSVVAGLSLAAGVVASAWVWRKGADAGALLPLVGGFAVLVLTGYGAVAPTENGLHGHKGLASALDRLLPPAEKTVMFFHELDEGLWFYLRDRRLEPVPGSQPEYNDAFSLMEDIRNNRFEWDPEKRSEAQQKVLVDWIKSPTRISSYVLLRDERYDRFAPALAGLAEPVHREVGLKRNKVVLLRVLEGAGPVASADGAASPRHR